MHKNLAALRLHAGLDAAMFGRMTTGDTLSRCDAAIHVAHAFTVHQGFSETDYFTVLDDLAPQAGAASGYISSTELTTGVFYGYVVVDVPLLLSNIEGCSRADWQTADSVLAAEVVRRLVHLMAKVSPGAKKGSTAPYAHAHLMMVESGDEQPRSLANAFLEPVSSNGNLLDESCRSLAKHLAAYDEMYGRSTERRLAAMHPPQGLVELVHGASGLSELATWSASRVRGSV